MERRGGDLGGRRLATEYRGGANKACLSENSPSARARLSVEAELFGEQDVQRLEAVCAAALEVLGLHGGQQAHEWFWKGLTDPEPHVRLSAVKYLDRLDQQAHRDIFEAALYDPHPQIAQAAQRLVRGKGYTPLKW